MIVLLGESASGKSTIEKELVNVYGFKSVIPYTTRSQRNTEKDGIDYYFISENEFNHLKNNGSMIVHTKYKENWQYGIAKDECRDDYNKVVVLTPSGLRMLKKFKNINIYSFYIKVSRRDRLICALKRGDCIDETIRRNLSDVGQFDGIEREVDKVIYNLNYEKTPQEICNEIWDEIRH